MRHGCLAILAGATLFASSAHAAPIWKYVISDIEVVDLETMGGEESVANDINDNGEIVGWSHVEQGWQHAFLWRNGIMEDITPYDSYTAEARGINNLTQVVGYLQHPAGLTTHGFYWDARVSLHLLDSAYTGEDFESGLCASGSNAKAINNSGVITGVRIGGCNPPVPFIDRAARWASWSAPFQQIVPLGPSGKQNFAHNINSAGEIVGWDKDGNTYTGGFYWLGAKGEVPFPAVAAPVWPEPSSVKANGINDGGAIVGSATLRHIPPHDETSTRAFYWNGSSAQSYLLSPLADGGTSAAFEINNQSFSVGYRDNRDRWAMVWHSHFGGQTLPMPPGAGSGPALTGKTCEALAVNNRNASGLVQAVGFCKIGGERHAVLWNIMTQKVIISAPFQ